jgi:hypothetical protein
MAITTVGACKSFRGIDTANQEHDAELARIIPAVQAFLEEECGRIFDAGDLTEYFDGDEWNCLLLVARPPINSIANIWDDPTRAFTTPLASTTYEIKDAKAGIIRLLDGRQFSSGQRSIKLTYNGGFTSIPIDLQQAAIEMVWAAREKGAHNLIGVRSRSIADGNIQFVNLDWGSANHTPIIQKYSIRTGVA